MTIGELNQIISLGQWKEICEEIKKQGYRLAIEDDIWEYEYSMLVDRSDYRQNVNYISDFSDLEFQGILFKRCKGYEAYTFIVLMRSWSKWNSKDTFAPREMLLFTDAPYNEERMIEMHTCVPCAGCDIKHLRKEMETYNGKLICRHCQDDIGRIDWYRILSKKLH